MSHRPKTANDESIPNLIARCNDRFQRAEHKAADKAARNFELTRQLSAHHHQPSLSIGAQTMSQTTVPPDIKELVNKTIKDAVAAALPNALKDGVNRGATDASGAIDHDPVAIAKSDYAANLKSMQDKGISEAEYINAATTNGAGLAANNC